MKSANMSMNKELQNLTAAREVMTQRTTELARAIVQVALLEEAVETLQQHTPPVRPASTLSKQTRIATAERALTATVQRLLQKRQRHIPG